MNHEDELTGKPSLAGNTKTGLPQTDAPRFDAVEGKLDLRQQAEKLARAVAQPHPKQRGHLVVS